MVPATPPNNGNGNGRLVGCFGSIPRSQNGFHERSAHLVCGLAGRRDRRFAAPAHPACPAGSRRKHRGKYPSLRVTRGDDAVSENRLPAGFRRGWRAGGCRAGHRLRAWQPHHLRSAVVRCAARPRHGRQNHPPAFQWHGEQALYRVVRCADGFHGKHPSGASVPLPSHVDHQPSDRFVCALPVRLRPAGCPTSRQEGSSGILRPDAVLIFCQRLVLYRYGYFRGEFSGQSGVFSG